MLDSHPSAALEYWFFKVNSGSFALLVDWIARRRLGENWLRVSIHSPHKREVLFEKRTTIMSDDCFLRPQRTVGQLGDVAWALDINLHDKRLSPQIFPSRLVRMVDTELDSAPLSTFTGWIRHGSEQVTLQDVPGMVSQYWGRGLTQEWWWLSANQFDQPGFAVECSVFRSAVWGTAIQFPGAYLYLRQPDKEKFIKTGFGLARASGTPEQFEIEVCPVGRAPIRLIGTGREYGDLGDGIVNTLVGDLEIHEGGRLLARATGTAGLERRFPGGIIP